jgi:hypothetical protein
MPPVMSALLAFVVALCRSRASLCLENLALHSRPIQPPACGQVIAVPEAGGLHHYYERVAA